MDRKELDELWRNRVAQAKLRFDLARNRTNAIVRDFPLADTSPDGRDGYRHAIRLENLALAEYNRVRQIYADLVTGGAVPDEDEWQRHKGAGGSGMYVPS